MTGTMGNSYSVVKCGGERGVVLVLINEITVHRARLVLGWVIISR